MRRRAVGRTAEVFDVDAARILKRFPPGTPRAAVEHEARVARAVAASGLPAPAVLDVQTAAEPFGILYERVDGPTLLEAVLGGGGDRRDEFAARLARLHAEVHRRRVSAAAAADLPRVKERMARQIASAPDLPEPYRERARRRLADLPDGRALCHGDFHPGNVLLPSDAPPVVIDWNDAAVGPPAADVARTLLLLTVGMPPAPLPPGFAEARDRFRDAYQVAYFKASAEAPAGAKDWLPVVAAARFVEAVPGERDGLLALLAAAFGRAVGE